MNFHHGRLAGVRPLDGGQFCCCSRIQGEFANQAIENPMDHSQPQPGTDTIAATRKYWLTWLRERVLWRSQSHARDKDEITNKTRRIEATGFSVRTRTFAPLGFRVHPCQPGSSTKRLYVDGWKYRQLARPGM